MLLPMILRLFVHVFMMPGANCCIVGCPTYASKAKYPALSFFKIPKGKLHEEWRSRLIRIVNRVDKGFNADNAFICSRHFKESSYKTGKFLIVISGFVSLYLGTGSNY